MFFTLALFSSLEFCSLVKLSFFTSKSNDLLLVPDQLNLPQEEEKVLRYWEEIDAFKLQLEKTKHLPPYTFYDGPPFATGLPHYGHLCAGTIKVCL